MKIGDIELTWLGNAGFRINNSLVIYIDPYNIKEGAEKANVILITHSHYDHCSLEDLNKIVQDGTKIICPADCQSKINRFSSPVKIQLVEPNSEIDLGTIKIATLPAYNINKPFHLREADFVGYLIKMKDLVIYHAGDTDKISEMQKLTGHQENFVALLPVGGRFTMGVEEAVDAAKLIKPSLAIPMHYGSIVGNDEDAKEFVQLCGECGVEAKMMDRE